VFPSQSGAARQATGCGWSVCSLLLLAQFSCRLPGRWATPPIPF